jgi:hypothetical protein
MTYQSQHHQTVVKAKISHHTDTHVASSKDSAGHKNKEYAVSNTDSASSVVVWLVIRHDFGGD